MNYISFYWIFLWDDYFAFREFSDVEEFTLLENMTEHINTVLIMIKECKG